MRRRFVRCGAALAAVLLLAVLALPCLAAGEQTVLRVACPQTEGFTRIGPDGSPSGLVVDFLNEIAKYTGWKFEYVPTNSDDLLDDFFMDKFDLMGGNYYAEGMEEYFAYPDYNCGYTKVVLLARKDDPGVKSHDLSSFNGKTIGVFERATENIRRLKEFLSINGLDCTLRYFSYDEFSENGDLYPYLASGEVDLLVSNSSGIDDAFYIAASFDSQAHYIVTQPGRQDLIDQLNMALGKIYDADPNYAQKVYEKNFPSLTAGYAMLNDEERAYIARKGTVTVAVPDDFHPMFCLDTDDYHDGLVPDVLAEVTAYSGLEFSYVRCASYAEAVETVKRGEADLLGFFLGTEEHAADQGLALTASYAELDSILVRNKESSYPAEGLVGGVLVGRRLPSGIEAAEVLYYENAAAALSDVNRGKLDFFYGTSAHLENIIQQKTLTNVVHVNLINDSMDVGFALTTPVQPELLTILNKSINNLSAEQRDTLSSRNLISIGAQRMTLSSIIYADPALAISVVAAFLILILVAVILVARSRLHAAAMQMELERAEADSRAKSEFLSRMSHEIRTPMNAIVGLTDLTALSDGLPDKARESLGKIKASTHYLLSLINDILDMSRIESGKMDLARDPFSMGALLDEIVSMMKAEAENHSLNFRLEREIRDDVLVGDPIRLRQVLLNLLSNAFKFTPSGGAVCALVSQDASTGQEATYTFRVTDNGVGIAPEDQQRIFNSFEQVGPNITKSQGTGLGLAISSHIVELMGGELKLNSAADLGSEFYFTLTLPKGSLPDAPAEPSGGEDLLRGARILLVEDNDLNAEIATELLELPGASVRRAVNGRDALEQFSKSAPGEIDLILMDILMPEMNGLDATRAIRALPRPDAASIPILAMTANAFREDVESSTAAGMTGFIPKPIDADFLYQTLRQALLHRSTP